MNDVDKKLEMTRTQLLTTQEKGRLKIELETLRHKNVMEELQFMAKNKIKSGGLARGEKEK